MERKSKILALRYFPDENDLAVTYFDMAGPQINGPERIKALNHIVKFFLENAPEDDPYRSCFEKRRNTLINLTEFSPVRREMPEPEKKLKKAEQKEPEESREEKVAQEEERLPEIPEVEDTDAIMLGVYDSFGMNPGN